MVVKNYKTIYFLIIQSLVISSLCYAKKDKTKTEPKTAPEVMPKKPIKPKSSKKVVKKKNRVQKWLDRYRINAKSNTEIFYPTKVAIVKDLNSKQKSKNVPFVDIDQYKIFSDVYFDSINIKNFVWNERLNSSAKLTASQKLFYLGGVNVIVKKTKNNKFKLYHNNIKGEKFLAQLKKNNSIDKNFGQELLSELGWDGVVLDQTGDEVLVGSSRSLLSNSEKIQSLVVEGSAKRIIIDKKTRKGSGILNFVESFEDFAIFKIILLSKGQKLIELGSKLIIEKKK